MASSRGVPFDRTHTGRMFDKTIRQAIRLERFKAGMYARLSPLLDGMFDDVVRNVRNELPALVRLPRQALSTPAARSKMSGVIRKNQKITKGALTGARIQITDELRQLALAESDWAMRALKTSIPVDVSLQSPSPRLLTAAVQQAPIHGALLTEWFGTLDDSVRKAMGSTIRSGIVEGQGVEGIVRSIVGEKGVSTAFRRNVRSAVRTMANGVSSQAREDTWAKNDDIVEKVQFIATLDRRTTDICAGLDGKMYKINEGPRPPMHIQCRSTTTPVLKSWREMGIDLTEMKPATRAQMPGSRGLATEKTTYGQWLKRQNKGVQADVLGKERAKLFRSGKVQIDEFVDYSKATPRSYTIEELRSKAGLAPGRPRPPRKIKETVDRFSDGKGHYTPARAVLHDRIINQALRSGRPQEKPVFQMMGGGPASGKSSVINSGKVKLPKNNVMVDSDEIKKALPEFGRLLASKSKNAAAVVHAESSHVSVAILEKAGQRRFNATLDGTGNGNLDKLRKRARILKSRGYRVKADYVTCDTAEALRRNEARYQQTGRKVPDAYVKQVHKKLSETIPKALKENIFDEFHLWDNNAVGQVTPKLIASQVDGVFKIHNKALWRRFLAKAEGDL